MSEVNMVQHKGYTQRDKRIQSAKDTERGQRYLDDNFAKPGAIFLIKLEHFEGEFPLGLAQRTFSMVVDNPAEDLYEVRWYERISKNCSWGRNPKFRWSKIRFRGFRESAEARHDFLPLEVSLTDASTNDNPRLTDVVVDALRSSSVVQEAIREARLAEAARENA